MRAMPIPSLLAYRCHSRRGSSDEGLSIIDYRLLGGDFSVRPAHARNRALFHLTKSAKGVPLRTRNVLMVRF